MRPKPPSPIPLAQVGEPHLDAAGRAAFDALHDTRQRQFGQDRQEHVDIIARLNAFHDMDMKPRAMILNMLVQGLCVRSICGTVGVPIIAMHV